MAASSAQFTGDSVYNQNNSALGFAQFRHKFQRYASIVGFALSNTGSASGDHYIQYYRNGTKLADFKAGTGANGDFWGTHAKGTYAFSPGDTLTIYWSTGTIGSSIRYYRDDVRYRPKLPANTRVTPPAAICVWPHDLVRPPREWAARLYDVRQYTVQPHGGHFPAWEQPELYAADLRRFSRSL